MTEEATPETAPPPYFPTIPNVLDVPRDSAEDTAAMAWQLCDDIQGFTAVDGDLTLKRIDAEAVFRLRRQVATVADLIVRRGLSKAAALDAQEAGLRIDRFAGLVARAQGAAGALAAFGSAAGRISDLARIDADAFEAAVFAARNLGSLALVDVMMEIPRDGAVSDVAEQTRTRLADLAGRGLTTAEIAADMMLRPIRVEELAAQWGIEISGPPEPEPPVDAKTKIGAWLGPLTEASLALREVDAAAVAKLSPEQARDLAREVWAQTVPLVGLHKILADRGRA
jgi:hypothetical protein